MTTLIPIVTDKKQLTKPCQKISLEEGEKVARQLEAQLLARDNAAGLAAPQIGIDARVFVIRAEKEKVLAFINPEITEENDLEFFRGEGCLSFPGEWINTMRYTQIVVTDDTHPAGRKFQNFAAIAIQHENDHINGVLMHEREARPYELCPCGSGKKLKFCHLR